jgi:hypothetical protein
VGSETSKKSVDGMDVFDRILMYHNLACGLNRCHSNGNLTEKGPLVPCTLVQLWKGEERERDGNLARYFSVAHILYILFSQDYDAHLPFVPFCFCSNTIQTHHIKSVPSCSSEYTFPR